APVGDLLDLRVVDGRVLAVGGDHRERGHDDAVVQVQRRAALLVLRRVGKGGGGGVQVGDELGVGGAGKVVAQVDAAVVLNEVVHAYRPAHLLEPCRVDGGRGPDEGDHLASVLGLELTKEGAGRAERFSEDHVGLVGDDTG